MQIKKKVGFLFVGHFVYIEGGLLKNEVIVKKLKEKKNLINFF